MPQDHRQKVRRIFMEAGGAARGGARGRPRRARAAGDAALRAEVEALLRADGQAGGFMAVADGRQGRRVDALDALRGRPAPPPASSPAQQIGRYKLLEQIGEGGFGTVWMAEQREPVRRRVALKIIKLGMDTKQVIARFEAERQALAMMDHPNIAKVLDAGATETGPAVLRDGVRQGHPDHRVLRPGAARHEGAARALHRASATRSSTRTRRASSTATSSRRTSSSRCTTACRCRR